MEASFTLECRPTAPCPQPERDDLCSNHSVVPTGATVASCCLCTLSVLIYTNEVQRQAEHGDDPFRRDPPLFFRYFKRYRAVTGGQKGPELQGAVQRPVDLRILFMGLWPSAL